jgi:uncharacterized repeat protein (TIGR01451 family)
MSHALRVRGRSRARRSRLRFEALEDRAVPSVLYDESVSGDLSNSQSAPTALAPALGTNSVLGSVGTTSGTQDWLSLHIPAGQQLDSLVLFSYTSTDAQGFTGVQRGTSFVGSTSSPGSYLGYAHFGTGATNNGPATNLVGTDILPIMGNTTSALGAQGFTPPLAAGDYTFLIQQLGAETQYQFDYHVSLAPAADLMVTKAHVGNFTQGDADDTYSITVSNGGTVATTGTVTVTDVLPTGLTPTAANTGVINGWTVSVNGQTVTATRSDGLAAGNAYPALVVTVNVAADATDLVNMATVAGGGETDTSNDSADDPTTILPDNTPNVAPVNTLPATFGTNEDTPVVLAGVSMSDADAGNWAEQVTFTVPTGTLTLDTTVIGGVTADQVTGNGTGTVVVTARPAAINATLAAAAGLTFSPVGDANGDVTLTMTSDDLGHTGPGGPLTDQDFATISVAPVDDAPTIATNVGLTLNPGTTAVIGAGLLAATDVDNAAGQLTFTVTTGPTHGTVLLNGTPATTFTQADVNSGLVAYQHDNSAGTTDSFAFTVSDGTLSAGPATFAISILKTPTVTADPTAQTAFAGTFVTFTAAADGSPAPTVQWQASTGGGPFADVPGATSPTLTFKVDPTQDGTLFRAVFTNTVGSATTAAARLTVTPGLVVTADPLPQTVVVGTTATFTAAATGTKRPRMQWQVSTDGGATWAAIPGAVGPKLRVRGLATFDDNLYRAVFTNAAGTAVTAAAGLNLDYTVPVGTMRRMLALPTGTAVTLNAALPNMIGATVQWEVSTDKGRHYTPVAGATSATLALTAGTGVGQTGDYLRAVFTAGTKVRRTGTVILTVGDPPAVTAAPNPSTVAAGGTATFTVTFGGALPVKVQWQVSTDGGKTFVNVRGAMRPTLTLMRVKAGLNGNLYRAVLTNGFDQVATVAAPLTVT